MSKVHVSKRHFGDCEVIGGLFICIFHSSLFSNELEKSGPYYTIDSCNESLLKSLGKAEYPQHKLEI